MTVEQIIFEYVKIIGGLAGLIALFWNIFGERKNYLRIKVESFKDGENYTILTEVENVNKFSKKTIDNAFLIISPERSNLIKTGQRIAKELAVEKNINSTNKFAFLSSDKNIYIENKIIFIPLEYYYSENVDIADEKLTYRCYIDKTLLNKGQYSVRFYIYGGIRLHRSTQDLFIID